MDGTNPEWGRSTAECGKCQLLFPTGWLFFPLYLQFLLFLLWLKTTTTRNMKFTTLTIFKRTVQSR